MKHLTVLLAMIVALLATAVLAEEPLTSNPTHRTSILRETPWFLVSSTFLTTSATRREVDEITFACAVQVKTLLSQLAKAATEEQVDVLVRAIHQAEAARDVSILSVYIQRAEVTGRYGLAYNLKAKRDLIKRGGRPLEIAVAD